MIWLLVWNTGSCYEYFDSPNSHSNVQMSRDGWVPLVAAQPQVDPLPEVKPSDVSLNLQPVASAQGVDDDVVSYDYGSSEDEASVVVRPYEVPNQVPIQLLATN